MKVTIGEILDFADRYKTLKDIALPAKTSFKLVHIAKQINDEVNMYQESVNKLITEYCVLTEEGTPKLNENGGYIMRDGQSDAKLRQDVQDLIESEVEIASTLTIEDLSTVDICPDTMLRLMPIINE